MATAQSLVVQGLIDLINSNGNINAEVIASSPSAGYVRVTARAAGTPSIGYLTGGSSVTGAGTFVSYPSTGSPKYAELAVSWTLAPGDTVKINVGDGVRSVDMTYNLPLNTVVDPGGFDHSTAAGGGGAGAGAGGVIVGGSGVASAQHRRLVVVEAGSASASFGSMFALDPQDATGVAIPTFRVTNALPASGSVLGQAVYVTATRQGYAWDGTAWRDITASPIRSFLNDALLQANTTEGVGTYAVASDTGNMYVKTADGWRRIGVAEFGTYNDLNTWDAALGTQAISRDLDVLFLRVADGAGGKKWIPISEMVRTTAEILATPNIEGLVATSTETGSRYVNNGTRWVEDPIEHYPTEAALLAATPIDGHLAWADDTNVVFTAAGGTWHRLQGPQITVGTTTPAAPGVGDQWFDQNPGQRVLKVWDGAIWRVANGGTVGIAGSRLNLPGYFNENPSDAAVSDEVGGVAYRYNGAQTQLFLNRGTAWNAMTPMMGDPANQGKVFVADANGNAQWATIKAPTIIRTETPTVGISRPSHSITLEGSLQPSNNASLWLIAQREGNWVDWSHVIQSFALQDYRDGGYASTDLKGSNEWSTNQAGLALVRQAGSYRMQAGKYASFHIHMELYSNGNMTVAGSVHLNSDNSTPMLAKTSFLLGNNQGGFADHMTSVGIKVEAGNINTMSMTVTYD